MKLNFEAKVSLEKGEGKKKKKRKKEEKNKIEETFTPLGHENPGLIVRVKTELLTRHTFFFPPPPLEILPAKGVESSVFKRQYNHR